VPPGGLEGLIDKIDSLVTRLGEGALPALKHAPGIGIRRSEGFLFRGFQGALTASIFLIQLSLLPNCRGASARGKSDH